MSKQSLVERAARAAERFGAATDAVDEAAAQALHVNRTDLRILAELASSGTPMTAGGLAVAARRSPAAITSAIQRLAARGLVERRPDEADRRRAVVDLTDDARDRIDRIYGPVAAAGLAALQRLSQDELRTVAEVLERGHAIQAEQAERIRTGEGPHAPAPDAPVPRPVDPASRAETTATVRTPPGSGRAPGRPSVTRRTPPGATMWG